MLTANLHNNIQEGNPPIQLCDKKSSIFHHQDPFLCGNHSSLRTHAHTSKHVYMYLSSFLICPVESVHMPHLMTQFQHLPLPRDNCTHLLPWVWIHVSWLLVFQVEEQSPSLLCPLADGALGFPLGYYSSLNGDNVADLGQWMETLSTKFLCITVWLLYSHLSNRVLRVI